MTPQIKRAAKARLLSSTVSGLALASILALSSAAHAEEDTSLPGEFSGNVALTSNYIYRGVTQSNDGPAISGGFDYEQDIFYAGVWGSSVEWDGTSLEVDYYVGATPSYKNFNFDIGLIYYTYPDAPSDPEQNFVEIYGGVSTTIEELVEVGASLAISPEFYGESGQAYYTALDASVPLPGDTFSLAAHYGYQAFDDDLVDDYSDYNIGVTASYEGFDLTLGYSDTSDRDGGDEDDSIFVSLSRSF